MFENIKAALDAVDPKLFYLIVSGIVGGVIWAWRRLSISSWDWVTRRSPSIQQLPALVLAGLLSYAPAAGLPLIKVLEQVILGALAGALPAIAGHEMMKKIPQLPYNGGKAPAAPPAPGPYSGT
jgi:hypothetical protein